MQTNYPKFDKKIQEHVDLSKFKGKHTRPGTIMEYDRFNNVALIMVDDQHSEAVGTILHAVPCPTIRGVQTVSPTSGTRCLVGFRDANEVHPYVINFFDDTLSRSNTMYNSYVTTGIPKFMVH